MFKISQSRKMITILVSCMIILQQTQSKIIYESLSDGENKISIIFTSAADFNDKMADLSTYNVDKVNSIAITYTPQSPTLLNQVTTELINMDLFKSITPFLHTETLSIDFDGFQLEQTDFEAFTKTDCVNGWENLQTLVVDFSNNPITEQATLNNLFQTITTLENISLYFENTQISSMEGLKTTFSKSQVSIIDLKYDTKDPSDQNKPLMQTVQDFLVQFAEYHSSTKISFGVSLQGCNQVSTTSSQIFNIDSDALTCIAQDCDKSCGLRCTTLYTNICYSCADTYYLFNDNSQGQNNCISKDDCAQQIGYYANDTENTCIKCGVIGCMQCTSAIDCQQCEVGQYFDNTSCVTCDVENCVDCEQKGECTQCDDSYVNQDGACKTKCNTGFYNLDGTCTTCIANCDSCDDGESCTQCTAKYTLTDDKQCDKCIANCQSCEDPGTCDICNNKFYVKVDGDTQTCTSCEVDNCFSCQQKENTGVLCSVCDEDFYLSVDQTQCSNTCPEGSYASQFICKSCIASCQQCTSGTSCDQCIDEFYPKKGVANISSCAKCSVDNCQDCQTLDGDLVNGVNCGTCSPDYYLSYTYDSCTKGGCPKGSYSDGESFLCNKCPQNCADCDAQSCTECMNGYYLSNGQCAACDDVQNCYSCSQSGKCDACQATYFLSVDKTTCYDDECLAGEYPQASDNAEEGSICQDCLPSCDICQDGTSCDSCKSGTFESSDVNNDVVCSDCKVDECFNCQEDTDNKGTLCSECTEPKFLSIDRQNCLDACPDGEFPNNNSQCEQCQELCDNCSVSKSCDTCSNGYYPKTDDTDPNASTCTACKENCLDCQSAKDQGKTCSQCGNNTYLSVDQLSCVGQCPDGTWADEELKECNKCEDFCLKCSTADTCLVCQDGYYQAVGVHTVTCDPCKVENCQSCTDGTQHCTTCKINFILTISSEDCVAECPAGQYNKNGQCDKCIDNCDSCSTSTTCDTCSVGYFSDENQGCTVCAVEHCDKCDKAADKVPVGQSCQQCNSSFPYVQPGDLACDTVCPQSYFADTKTNKCTACIHECLECQGKNGCLKCADGYRFNGLNQCKACSVLGCLSCQEQEDNSGKFCSGCDQGLLLSKDRDECGIECPAGQYNSKPGMCDSCIAGCKSCKDQVHCDVCLDGFYKDGTSGSCLACSIENCAACTSKTTCIVCAQEKYLSIDQTMCVAECGDREYPENNTMECRNCMTGCSQCMSAETCQMCDNTKYFDLELTACITCGVQGCLDCQGVDLDSKNKCLVCNSDLYLGFYDNQCSANCIAGQFPVPTTKNQPQLVCGICYNNCQKCDNKDTCGYCDNGYYVSLPEKDKSTTCTKCPVKDCSHCQSTTGQQQQCTQCSSGLVLAIMGNLCLESCGVGQFVQQGQCQYCVGNCADCITATQCHTCSSGYSLNNLKNECNPNGTASYIIWIIVVLVILIVGVVGYFLYSASQKKKRIELANSQRQTLMDTEMMPDNAAIN